MWGDEGEVWRGSGPGKIDEDYGGQMLPEGTCSMPFIWRIVPAYSDIAGNSWARNVTGAEQPEVVAGIAVGEAPGLNGAS